MSDQNFGQPPPFQAGRARRRRDGAESTETNNPTVYLGPANTPREGSDPWLNSGSTAAPYAPDVAELSDTALRTATEDLWALTSSQGAWHGPNRAGQSDFLMAEPYFNGQGSGPSEFTAPARPITGPSPSGSLGNASTSLGGTAHGSASFDEPLRRLSIVIQTAIEHHLAQQGEELPIARTPENAELVRRLALNYLRHDRAAAEVVPDAAEVERLLVAVVDEVLGYGPLDPLLHDESPRSR